MSPEPVPTAVAVLLISRDDQVRAALRALLEAGGTRPVEEASGRAEAMVLLSSAAPAVAVVHLGWRGLADDAALVAALGRRGMRVVVVGGPGACNASDVPPEAEALVELDAGPDALLVAVDRACRRGPTASAG